MDKLMLESLSVEITRKCNMSCLHCMRGNAQNLDINHSDIRNILKNIGYIRHFCITGGEPSLNVKAIRYILKQVKQFEIKVYEFYIVTNGTRSSMSKEFIDICSGLYDHQQRKEMSENSHMLEMSDDRFHDNTYHENIIVKLSKLPFFGMRGQFNNIFLFKEGRCSSGNENHIEPFYIYDCNNISGCVYLNAEGMILYNGDLSYHRQEENILCHSGSFRSYNKISCQKIQINGFP